MSGFNRYWAEEAIGEPFVSQDYRWMKSARRTGMLLGGVTSVLTTGVLVSVAVYHLVEPAPRVSISSYQIELTTAPSGAPSPSQPPNVPISKRNPSPAPADSLRVVVAASQKPALPHGAAAALAMVPPKPEHAAKAPVKAALPNPPVQQVKAQVAPAPAAPDRIARAPAPAVPDQRLQAKSPDTTPAVKPDVDTRIGLSKAAESKPTDIASGEKLGIREILPDGIVMQNGRRIKNGSPLPNGEILMGTDATKGMAETDRRVLVLTP